MDKKGASLGLLSGVLWGLDTTINSMLLLTVPFILIDPKLVSGALLLAFFHDFISASILFFDLLIHKELNSIKHALKSRSGRFLIMAAIFAGPIGMRSYLYAVESIGSGLASTISVMYPALAAVFGVVFLRDNLKRRGWLGLLLIIISILILGFSQSSFGSQHLLGILAAFLCVFGWASESVVTAYGMREDIAPKKALFIRQSTSSLVYFILMMFEGDAFYSIQTVLSSPTFFTVCLVGLFGTLSYFCYYSSIERIGPVRATGLNVTYSVWTSIFSLLFGLADLDVRLICCSILVVAGSSLMIKE